MALASLLTQPLKLLRVPKDADWDWDGLGLKLVGGDSESEALAFSSNEGDCALACIETIKCHMEKGKSGMRRILLEPREFGEEYDVLVAGGGTSGAAAAIAAAREKGRVLLLERELSLGGLSTNGRITNHYHGNRVGFAAEIDRLAAAYSYGKFNAYQGSWAVEARKKALMELATDAGVHVCLHQECFGVSKEGRNVTGVLAATLEGPCLHRGNVIIDSTGNSDVAAAAGAKCMFIHKEPALQGTGVPKLVPGQENSNWDFTFTSNSNILDISRTLQLATEIHKSCFDVQNNIDSRERRRIVADYNLKVEDAYSGRCFKDCITRCFSRFDTHGFMTNAFFELLQPSGEPRHVELPYSALLPAKVENIICTGLGIGADRDAMPFIRMQPDVLNQGYAAGKAAMLAVRGNTTPRKIKIAKLQRLLVKEGILPKGYDRHADMVPVFKPLPMDAQNIHECVAAIMLRPGLYLKELKQRFTESQDLRIAQLLAILGDEMGAGSLAKEVENVSFKEDLPGWNYTGMGQAGRCASRIDNILHTMSRLSKPYAAQGVAFRLKELEPETAFSHFRSVCSYLMVFPSSKSAPKLARLLKALLEKPIPKPATPLDTCYRNWRLKCFYTAGALLKCKLDSKEAREFLEDCIASNEAGFSECATNLIDNEICQNINGED
ncbi:MAG: FAD-dependent oxidoreductase [Victivallales bacterium]|nr:FAD-dependent oxidoreductase [Victivallales bacterium]